LLKLERERAEVELQQRRKCYEVALAKSAGATVVSLPVLWVGYRQILKGHRLVPLILTGAGAWFVGGVASRWTALQCEKEFLVKQPAAEFPLAAKARAVVRSYCPTHSFLNGIAPAADVTPSDRYAPAPAPAQQQQA
jgi:hypothetical protein